MGPVWMTLSDLLRRFQGHDIIQRKITQKLYKLELYLRPPTNRKSYMIYWTVPFLITLNWTTPAPGFKVTPFFDVDYLRNGTRYRQFQWKTTKNLHTPCTHDTNRRAVSATAELLVYDVFLTRQGRRRASLPTVQQRSPRQWRSLGEV